MLLGMQTLSILFLSLAGSTLAQTLGLWLEEPDAPLLSSQHLEAYVPVPVNPERPHAYHRFSLLDALYRLRTGNREVELVRPAVLKEPDLLGITEDKYKLGLAYFWSLGGIERNLELALRFFEEAAKEGDADAMFMVGVAYSTGFLGAITPDHARATLYYTIAANEGCLEAQLAMGHRLLHGIHSVVDSKAALDYYSQAGDTILESLETYHQTEKWHYDRVNRKSFAFGAEMNTGLYGKHAYKQHVAKNILPHIPRGDQTAAWRFISYGFPQEFDNMEDAIETLFYRAQEELDTTAMYALARVYAAGFDGAEPDWDVAVGFARQCLQTRDVLPKRSIQMVNQDKIHSFCAEFLAERYLHGDEGVKQNATHARRLYESAVSKLSGNQLPIYGCRSCEVGIAMSEWVEAQQNGTLKMNGTEVNLDIASKLFKDRFAKVFQNSEVATDYTLPILLAKMQLHSGSTVEALETLEKAIGDSSGNIPVASLMLAHLQKGERRLNRYIQGIRAVDHLYSPIEFAHISYDRGDIESAVLAFMLSSELGLRTAALNLADLLDTRHSMFGAKHGEKWHWLRSFSEWPVPKFVKNRRELAAHYFGTAAVLGSVDALAKLVEYGWNYKLIPKRLTRWYLEVLIASNFSMAQWALGTFEYASKRYSAASDRFTRALVSPEAWLPVKFSQFMAAWKILVKEDLLTRDFPLWRRIIEIYQHMATFEPTLRADNLKPFSDVPEPEYEYSNYHHIISSSSSNSKVLRILYTSLLAGVIALAVLIYTRVRNIRN